MGRLNPTQIVVLGAAAALAVALIVSSLDDEAVPAAVAEPPPAAAAAAAVAEQQAGPSAAWAVGKDEDTPKTRHYEFPPHTGATRDVHFAKALILTLPRAKQRQASVRKNLARYNLPPIEFVDAVDAKPLKEGCHVVLDERPGKPPGWKTFNKECMQRRMDHGVDEKAADQMPHGHVAITLTWIKALRRVATMSTEELADDDFVYLFEDDVRVINMAPGTDLTLIKGVPADAELLDLGKGARAEVYSAADGGSFFHTFGGALVHALALSRRGARKALAIFEPSFYATIDVVLLSHLKG